MLKQIVGFLIVLWMSLNPLPGQDLKFKRLREADILSSGSVFAIAQDRQSFLWFGTEYGLYRFDGHDYRIYRHDPDQPNSLSDNTVWSLYEDRRGYLWVGTANGGLNRFDPRTEEFKHWKAVEVVNPVGPGLSDNGIIRILEDHRGILWIGTYKGGLNRFDPASETFYHWFKSDDSRSPLPANYIISLMEDHHRQLWIGTHEGLFRMEQNGDSVYFQQWRHDPSTPSSLSHNTVWHMYNSPVDSARGFWIGTFNGLNFYERQTGRFIHYMPDPSDPNPFSRSLGSISEFNDGGQRIFWIASYGGLLRFNPASGEFRRWKHDPKNPNSISGDQVQMLYGDRSQVLWIATMSGLSYYSSQWNKFWNWGVDAVNGQEDGPELAGVSAFCRTPDSTIWIGTGTGLYYLPHPFRKRQVGKYAKLASENIWSLCTGNAGDIWIGTYGNGLFRLETTSGQIQHWMQNESENESEGDGPGNNFIRSLHLDRYGFLWVGTWGRGLSRFNPHTGEWRSFLFDRKDPHSLSYNDVWVIHEDRLGNLWIGTRGGGLNLFDREQDRFYHWNTSSDPPAQLSHNSILTIVGAPSVVVGGDSLLALWIGTENGLNYFQYPPATGHPIQANNIFFTGKNGLPGSIIKSIFPEKSGPVWLGTNLGLIKVNLDKIILDNSRSDQSRYPDFLTFLHYTEKSGLPGNDFAAHAVIAMTDGEILWGNSGNLISFHPQQLAENSFMPPVAITEVQVQDHPLPQTVLPPPGTSDYHTDLLRLAHHQRLISFRFAALDYSAPEECRYQYQLEGFDRGWIDAGNRRFVVYTNLAPGRYTFRVKGTNSEGIWNPEITRFSFIISPPWWRTPLAYAGYFLLLLITVLAVRKYEMNRLRLRHQLMLQTIETRKFQELEKMKSRFFSNLSHEFRTPLMLITGPIEQLRTGQYKGNLQRIYDVISRNSRRLLDLIDQSLVLSQLEAGTLPLRAYEKNLLPLLRGLVFSFDSLAEKKGIQIIFDADCDTCDAWIDHDKFEKIINNLLSNAVKFTPAGGKISVSIRHLRVSHPMHQEGSTTELVANVKGESGGYIQIIVSDTGIGISPDDQKKIFDRFYQVDDSSGRLYGGSGIGLALVKELVDLHHWTISVNSQPGKGCTFILQIPTGRSHLKDQEIASAPLPVSQPGEPETIQSELSPAVDFDSDKRSAPGMNGKKAGNSGKSLPTVLIVEDSPDVRYYLSSILADDYHILEANTGAEGLKKAAASSPHLIISDIMMPVMDGIEFCRRIKSDFNTSHIPVILLTARASHESRLEGLETGADDYLVKPFERRELLIRLRNLIDQRQRIQQKFKGELLMEPSTLSISSLDEEFLKRAIGVVEQNLADADFETENFARSLYVSRSQLHRKLTALTGQTPGEFIRIVRLKRAAQLLRKGGPTVSEVAYEVGFKSLSHFAKAFRRQFHCAPSEYPEN